MANYANQKTIYLNDKEIITHKQGSGEPFLEWTDWKYLEAAARHLKGENFKVYLYFLSWYGKGKIEYSPTDVKNKWGIGATTARDAIDILISKGYLIPVEGKYQTYNFYPVSHTEV